MNESRLEGHFTYRKLIKFSMPCIGMMIITSIYSIVDGFFVSNFAGKNAFAAVNLIMPILLLLSAFGFMIGTGGSALVAYTLGKNRKEEANQIFTMLIKVVVVVGIILSILGYLFMPQITSLLGASDLIKADCILYGKILLIALPFFMLQNAYQSFLVAADRMEMGLVISIVSGVLNIILDFLFVYLLELGIMGAAIATTISQVIGAIVPTIYFLYPNKSLLHFTRSHFSIRSLCKACLNGSSEMLTNISSSLIAILYNFQLMRLAGENGLAAYGVIMYVSFIFMAVFFGYAIAINPVIAFHFGAKNHLEIKNLLKKSLVLTLITSIAMFLISELLAHPIAKMFVGYDQILCDMTVTGLKLYAWSFLICGFNTFGSAFFTGLNNGSVSALLAFLRTLVFQAVAICILPLLLGIDGVWLAIVAAEGMTLIVTLIFLIINREKYRY